MIKQGHSKVIAIRGSGQLAIYFVGAVIGYLISMPLLTFGLCTFALVLLEVLLARKFQFSPRTGSISAGWANSIWSRLVVTLLGAVMAFVCLSASLATNGWTSALAAVFGSIFAYSVIGINLPASLEKKSAS